MELDNITCDGRKPVNPIGTCFDSAAWSFIELPKAKMCHGIGVSNLPGAEPDFIAHAWLEFMHEGQLCALDTTWMIGQPAEIYRQNLKLNYVVEYGYEEFIKLWAERHYPGPYDTKIMTLTKEGKANLCSQAKA